MWSTGSEKCHFTQIPFMWGISTHNKSCMYGLMETELVYTVLFTIKLCIQAFIMRTVGENGTCVILKPLFI
jgi:hypothetical protein